MVDCTKWLRELSLSLRGRDPLVENALQAMLGPLMEAELGEATFLRSYPRHLRSWESWRYVRSHLGLAVTALQIQVLGTVLDLLQMYPRVWVSGLA